MPMKPSKKAMLRGSWVSKYTQNPFIVHLKEHQDPKKVAPTHLHIPKEVQGGKEGTNCWQYPLPQNSKQQSQNV